MVSDVLECPPHDWLKILHWRHHYETSLLPIFLKGTNTWAAIEKHHKDRWISDQLSAAIARQFFDGSEYVDGDLETGEHFFVPVYEKDESTNGVIRWPYASREKLDQEIREIFNAEFIKGGSDWENRASKRINNKLWYFPADTWTPFVSLAAHHMMTWILHNQGEGEIRNALEYSKPEFCLLMVKVNETDFYALKEMRSFYAKREKTLQGLSILLQDKLRMVCGVSLLSLKVGDELCSITVNRKINQKMLIDTILQTLASSNLQYQTRLVQVPVGQIQSQMRNKPYWVVNGPISEKIYAFGLTLEEASTECAEWVKLLNKKWVAWISIEPQLNLVDCCSHFLIYAVKVLELYPHKKGVAPSNSYESQISPDLMLSVVIGYQAFLNDVANFLDPKSAIMRSFSRSLFAIGIENYLEACAVYERLLLIKQRLHFPINISIVATDSKYPFWRVLELFYTHPNNITIIPKGGPRLSLTEADIELMNSIIPTVRRIKPTVWRHEIVPASARNLKELEFELNKLTSGTKRKLTQDNRDEIIQFILKIEQNHLNSDETNKKRIRYEMFMRLSDFAGTQLQRRHE